MLIIGVLHLLALVVSALAGELLSPKSGNNVGSSTESHTDVSAGLTSVSHDSGLHLLEKRSHRTIRKCVEQDHIYYDPQNPNYPFDNRYRFLNATCLLQDASPVYFVWCSRDIHTPNGHRQAGDVKFEAVCEDPLVCFKLPDTQNSRGVRAADVSCRLRRNGKKGPTQMELLKSITTEPDSKGSTITCSDTVTLPLMVAGQRKGVGASQRQYRLTELTSHIDGEVFKVPELFVKDVTTSTPYRQHGVSNSYINIFDIKVWEDVVKKVQFCMILAAGVGYSVYFQYEVNDVTGLKGLPQLEALDQTLNQTMSVHEDESE